MPLKARLVPAKTVVPSAGATIVTTGGVGVTVRRAVADPGAPSESVTAATSVCAPSESSRVPFGPRTPSRLDVQRICPVRSPSKSSLAAAPSRTAVPAGTELPSAGLAIVTAGGVFGARTRMLVWAWPPSPPESVTAAVTVCSPTVSALVVTVAPVPRLPSRLDVHSIRLDSSPSSASRAWAAKVIASRWKKMDPAAGAAMVTVGAARATVTMRVGAGPPSRER